MTREEYIRVTGRMRDNPGRIRLVKAVNRVLTGGVFVTYPLFLLLLFLEKRPFLSRAVMVPAVSFAAVSLFRKVADVPRPYEKYGVPPVLDKDTKGKSFPSRHVFSAFIIAVTVFRQYPAAGLLLAAAGTALGWIRVAGGVHEPRDVVAGAAAGVICGVAGYYLF